jgi:hypothetical protein
VVIKEVTEIPEENVEDLHLMVPVVIELQKDLMT